MIFESALYVLRIPIVSFELSISMKGMLFCWE